jgi:hypothetical protein
MVSFNSDRNVQIRDLNFAWLVSIMAFISAIIPFGHSQSLSLLASILLSHMAFVFLGWLPFLPVSLLGQPSFWPVEVPKSVALFVPFPFFDLTA